MTYLSTKRTLADRLNTWLENEAPVIRASIAIHYMQLVRVYIILNIGMISLKDFRTGHFAEFYSRLNNQGLGAPKVRKIHTVLQHSLYLAAKTGLSWTESSKLYSPTQKTHSQNKDPR
jgi:hypothetical protein